MRQGLAQTYALCLPGSPGADVLPATVATWADDLWHDARFAWADPETDARRIAHAFRLIRAHAERWPTLRDFVQKLPEPPQLVALTHKPCSDEQAAQNVTRLLAMVDEVFGRKA
jgi:hypothetical protein